MGMLKLVFVKLTSEWDSHAECNSQLRPSRLLFPVKQKNYSADPFINNQWEILRSFLKHAYLVTIFGYSAPATDIEALMLSAWKDNPTIELAQFNIVDIKNREELKHSWRRFFCEAALWYFDNLLNTYIFRHPRRTCEAFAMATLQQEPWRENRFPFIDDLPYYIYGLHHYCKKRKLECLLVILVLNS